MKKKEIKKIRIGIDVDGVLRDFDGKVVEVLKELYPDKIKSEITTEWDFRNIIDMDPKKISSLWVESKSAGKIFGEANLMPNAKEELKLLKEWGRSQKNLKVKFAIVTTQIPYNMCHTFYWLGKNEFNFQEVHNTTKKHEMDINYLIDDSENNYYAWVDSGRDESAFILFDRPYNQNCPASNRIYKLSEFPNKIKI